MKMKFVCEYPLPHIHEGTMLGNGYLGLYAWGDGNELRVSIGCSALWDHRGGMSWTARQNFKDIRNALVAKDMDRINAIFATDVEADGGKPLRPTIVPVGRIVFTLRKGCRLLRNELDRQDGGLRIYYSCDNSEKFAELRLKMKEQGTAESLFALKCDDVKSFTVCSSYDLSLAPEGGFDGYGGGNVSLPSRGFSQPIRLKRNNLDGFVQAMPADDAFGLAVISKDGLFTGSFMRAANVDALKIELLGGPSDDIDRVNPFQADILSKMLPGLSPLDWETLVVSNTSYWAKFWKEIPDVSTGSETMDEIYSDGIFKFGCMTAPEGHPAGLQGPWIEDYTFPPWSGDYHFNINVEMCYWPSFRSGLWRNLRRMLDMVWSWRDKLRENARLFIGIVNGYMMPHAVDDRGVCMGAFWTGSIDHTCTAWVAQLMFDYADYASDMDYLRNVAFDFMRGAMNVFIAMMERNEDGSLSLPVTVSPEYRGDAIDAWGVNSSFQLAAAKRLALNLVAAAKMLGLPPDPAWQDVIDHLPTATLKDGEIALWDGLLLEESHRHHSHLAGICPFDVIDPEATEWKDVIAKSVWRWNQLGMGQWSGWCVPWAAMIQNRLGNADAAELTLDIWRRLYTNIGGGSLHDGYFQGITIMCCRPQLMQMDGAMGAVTAVQDMLLHSRQGVIHLFAGCPKRHRNVSFAKMPAPGGFRISATRDDGNAQVRVTASRDNVLRLVCHCDATAVTIHRTNGSETRPVNGVLSLEMAANEPIRLEYRR
ncbi:MAG: hypothetical protein J5833_02475 [Victivallales bacterium]|nr:hypothetical protein [Victivallales bacterium]